MSNKRKLAVVAFALLTLACAAYLGLLWISEHLLSFPCEAPEDPRPCSVVIPQFFVVHGLLPVFAVLGIGGWLLFRRWGKN